MWDHVVSQLSPTEDKNLLSIDLTPSVGTGTSVRNKGRLSISHLRLPLPDYRIHSFVHFSDSIWQDRVS